jgi:hypothetical protein
MRSLIARLTGHSNTVAASFVDQLTVDDFRDGKVIGVSQLNEMLLALAYETVSEDFFAFVFGAGAKADAVSFDVGVERFEKLGLLKYGNVKFAFKTLAKMTANELNEEVGGYLAVIPVECYTSRPEPLLSIKPIDPAETYFLGHITGDAVKKGTDERRKRRLEEVRTVGRENLTNYLCSDEMDVYVATSMRDVEDFYFVGTAIKRLFEKAELAELKLRYFDPTQSFCDDRIEKGLVESLMLRRAKCTVYCAQTSETLGKDSELAVTLAQGKPVIVYVPTIRGNEDRYHELCRQAAQIHSEIFRCDGAEYYRAKLIERHSKALGYGIADIPTWDMEKLAQELFRLDDDKFEQSARVLSEVHPLGIQVDLDSGVANGVLVTRTLSDTAYLVRAVVTNDLKFRIARDENGTLRLVEERTGCTFRLMVSDSVLTNSFWNFYRPWIHHAR